MSSTIERVTLTAPDISCSHCVKAINDAVGGLDGVSHVEANESTKQVKVEFDPQRVSLTEIEAATLPAKFGPDLNFEYTFPKAGFYKIWVQFSQGGAVHTVDYVVEVK